MSYIENNSLRLMISDIRSNELSGSLTNSEASYGPMGASTAKGHRDKNDDCCWVDPFNGFIALSDGVGGAPYGDVISRVGCVAAMRSFRDDPSLDKAFLEADTLANNVIHYLGLQKWGSGATLLLATTFRGNNIEILSAGDSAAILLTKSGSRIICGRSRDEHNFLVSGIGFQGSESPRHYSVEVSPGDVMVFCSDGVTDALDLVEIELTVGGAGSAPVAADLLVKKAAEQGWDNATAAVVYI